PTARIERRAGGERTPSEVIWTRRGVGIVISSRRTENYAHLLGTNEPDGHVRKYVRGGSRSDVEGIADRADGTGAVVYRKHDGVGHRIGDRDREGNRV